MKKLLLTTISSAVLGLSFAAEQPALKDLTDMQNFYYEKGYNDASEKFYKSGYEQAVFDLVKAMQKYRTVIDSYEAGKYYMLNNKITFPRVYRTRDANGNYIIQIDAPEVKEKLSLEDIFILPELESNTQKSYNNSFGSNFNNPDISNPVYSASANTIYPVNDNVIGNTSPISITREFGVSFPKTERIKRILDVAKIKYAEMPSEYKAYFNNKNDFNTFCKNASGDIQCSNLFQK